MSPSALLTTLTLLGAAPDAPAPGAPATADPPPPAAEPPVAPAPPAPAPAPDEPEPDDPEEEAAGVGEIVVKDHVDVAEHETHAVTTLDAAQLEKSAGQDLGETVAVVPGVAVGRGNGDSTKPIIRGQVERRLLVIFDGVRHESQKWGLDHATEIDPFAAGDIHVIKGAAGVRYGPDAIGGVVLVDPPPMKEAPGVSGRVVTVGESNGRRGVLAARLDASTGDVSFRVEGDTSRGAAVSTPTYVLGNTAGSTWNLGVSAALRRPGFTLDTSWRHYDLTEGVCYCVRSGSPDEFLSQLDADAPLNSELWTTSYDIGRPSQAVRHDTARLRADADLGAGHLRATYAFQLNRRREYETARESVTGPQYDFTLRTHSLDATYDHGDVDLPRGWLEGGLGLASSFQENVYSGLPLVPNFRGFGGGIFGWERWRLPGLAVEVGARYDHLSRAAWLTPSAYERGLARGTIDADTCEPGEDAARCPGAWDAGSVSAGLIAQPVPEALALRLDLSSATRFPNVDELYMNGTAPTFPVYALGDPSLGTETTWGASPTVSLSLPVVGAELSGYANYIDDYVYFAPELGEDGAPVVDVTIEGAFPRFSFRAVDAWFYGADGGVWVEPVPALRLEAQGALVRGVDAAARTALVGVPADRVSGRAELRLSALGALDAAGVGVELEHVFAQTHVDPAADIAPPPPAYTLLGASANAEFDLGRRALRLGVEATNLLNTRYRDYSSLLRYYADEPGRDVRVRVAVDI